MQYFDFHTHAFTNELAQRALSGLAETSGIAPATDGTVNGLCSDACCWRQCCSYS